MKRENNILKKLSGRLAIVTWLLLAACHFSQAQVKFSGAAPASVGVNQQFQLTYTVENGNANTISRPNTQDFQVLRGPDQGESIVFNGRMTHSFTYTYILQPKKEGTFKIGKATATIEGVKVESNEVTVTVTGPVKQQAQRQRDPRDPFGFFDQNPLEDDEPQQQQPQASTGDNQKILKENVFIRMVTDKNTAYIGEKVTATMKLYFRAGFGIAQYAIPKAPTFDGFWSQEVQMPKEPKPHTETVNGQQYSVVDIQVYNLYPQKSGPLKVSSADFDMIVQAPVSQGWMRGYQNFNLKTASNGFTITAKELPAVGKPADFSGAVGQYTYSTHLSSKEGRTDNAITLSLKVAGAGNLKTIDLPKPELPEGFEVFDPKVKEDISNSASGMAGSKQYDYLIIPRQPGEYKVPATSFSYFDPSTGKYTSLSSLEQLLKITGEPSQNLNSAMSGSASKEDISALHSDIRYIKTKANSLEKNSTPFFGSVGFIGLLTTPFLLFIGLIFVRKKNEDLATDIVGAKRRRATKLAQKRLSAAEKHLSKNDKTAFYDEVSRALWGYLGDKLNIDQSQLSKDNVEEKLLSKNVQTASIATLKGIINTCELALYSPVGAGDEMKQNYNAAVSLITDLEDEIK